MEEEIIPLEWKNNPVYISDKIHPEFFMVEAFRHKEHKTPPDVIHKTSRRDGAFF